MINEKFLDGIRSSTNIRNIWASLVCRSTHHHNAAGSCKYLEGPYGSNLVHYSCPRKSHSLRMALDEGLICRLQLDGMMKTAQSYRGTWVCWGLPLEVMLHCSAPQYEAYHLTLVWAFTSAEVYFAIWRAVEINGAVRVMALDGMQYTYRQWIVVTARVWTYWGRLWYE